MKKYFCLIAGSLLVTLNALSQAQFVSVNKSTGTAIVNLPLGVVNHGGVAIPITASYGASGVKVKDVEGSAGMGWSFNVGGAITRNVRGLPDDFIPPSFQTDLSRRGILHSTTAGAIDAFTPTNTGSGSCSSETSDLSSINASIIGFPDTEPDIFNVNAPGLSFQMVLDKNFIFHTIPYQDVKISYVVFSDPYTSGNGRITSFTITNDKGYKYTFTNGQEETKIATSANPSAITFNKREYEQYKETVDFTNTWVLTSITDIGGNLVTINYKGCGSTYNVTPIEYVIGTASSKTLQYTLTSSYVNIVPDNITITADDAILKVASFHYQIYSNSGRPMIQSFKVNGDSTSFNYTAFGYRKPDNNNYYRYFLSHLDGTSGNAPLSLAFDYKGNTIASVGGNTTVLPDSTGKQIDYWGYYSGSTNSSLLPKVYVNASNSSLERYRNLNPGSSGSSYDLSYGFNDAERPANAGAVDAGSLEKITNWAEDYGTVTFEYEPNAYFDPTSAVNTEGAGIRIKKLTVYDGVNTANNIVTEYNYTDPATGNSSGKAISVPVYQFTRAYIGGGTTAQTWQNSIVRSEEDLSQEDHSVIYGHVKVSQAGAGYTRYEFQTPATNWDTSVPDWLPTVINAGRTSCTSWGYITNEKNTYPFPPNTNYEFERGLPIKETSYNSANVKVSQVDYTYQRVNSTTTKIPGLRIEENGTPYLTPYSKYYLYVDQGKLISQQTVTNFDMADASRQRQLVTDYQYASATHKLPTSVATTTNGVTRTSFVKYVKDFSYGSVTSGSSENAKALKGLYDRNINIPVESYQQLTRSSGSKIISASLIKFGVFTNPFLPDLYLPASHHSMMDPNGISSFSNAAIASGNLTSDSRYIRTENDNVYSTTGVLLSADDDNHHVSSKIIDQTWLTTVAEISNAKASEVGYYLSDYYSTGNYFLGPGVTLTTGRVSRFGGNMAANNIQSTSLKKNPLTSNNIFSIWIKSSSAGTVTVTTTNGTNTYNSYISYANTAGEWKYYQVKVQVPSTDFTAKFQSSTAITFDDALCYPDVADVSTFDYDLDRLWLIAKTRNGIAESYQRDGSGRIRYVYNQDKDILLKKSYIRQFGSLTAPTFSIYPASPVNTITSVTFYPSLYLTFPSLESVRIKWNFGDGSAEVITTSQVTYPTHTYTTAGTYTATMTVSSPYYGEFTVTTSITVYPYTPPCPGCPID